MLDSAIDHISTDEQRRRTGDNRCSLFAFRELRIANSEWLFATLIAAPAVEALGGIRGRIGPLDQFGAVPVAGHDP